MTKRQIAGHHFLPNNDLALAYRVGGLFVIEVWRCWEDVKIMVDSYCETACQECGCPLERYHARGCKAATTGGR